MRHFVAAAIALLPAACDEDDATESATMAASRPASSVASSTPVAPRARAIVFAESSRMPRPGLPTPCRHATSTFVAKTPTEVRFFTSRGSGHELAFSQKDTEVRSGILTADTERRPVRPFPWLDFGNPPVATRSARGWLAVSSAPGQSSLDALSLWREGSSTELLAEGDALTAWDAACAGESCAVLTSRVSRSAGPGASLFVGAYGAAARAWRRSDIAPTGAALDPFAIVAHDGRRTDVALQGRGIVDLWHVQGDAPKRAARWKVAHAPYAVLPAMPPRLLEAGAPPNGKCTGEPFPVRSASSDGRAAVLESPMPPASLAAERVGKGFLVVWVSQVNCRMRDRLITYAAYLDGAGTPVGPSVAVGPGDGFALTAEGDGFDLWLHAPGAITWVRGTCGKNADVVPRATPAASASAASSFKSGAK